MVDYGFQCHRGDPVPAVQDPIEVDVCKEICGDGYDLGHYECDDGNYNSGDGCSVLCFIENGWNCTGGTPFEPDVCNELCGDGRNFGTYECDDGNLINGDGCDSNCIIEFGWECYNGSPTKQDTCVEKCGDGLNFFPTTGIAGEKCDDGNVHNFDGCNEFCVVENGWICTGGSTIS